MTHRKIAELAHVSTSTVSKALSGSNEISAELAAEIRRIALESGYFSEKNKRKAVNNRKKGANIAVIIPEVISIHYSKIVTLLKSFIDERGGRTAIYIYDFEKTALNELVQSLSTDNLTDGIILVSSSELSKAPSVPVVSFDSFISHKNNFSIGVAIDAVLDDIVSYLNRLGHTKIGFVGELRTSAKENSFRKSMEKYNLDINESHILKIDKRFENIGAEAAKSIIASTDRPTAIVTAYDEVAVSLIYYLEKSGIKVPEDISVTGMNDIPLAPYIKTSLTTVRFNYDDQAALAVDVLYDKIYSGNDAIQHLIVNHELIIRDSVSAVEK